MITTTAHAAKHLRQEQSATCRNCASAVTNLPMSNRLYCILDGRQRVAVGRDHTCAYFERRPNSG